jgi:serine/threonine protein kinase
MVGDDARTNEEAVFAAAMEIQDPAERASYLRSACRGDEALLHCVTELLQLAEAPDSFLDGHASAEVFSALLIREGTHTGPYKLLEKLGEGGFGVVYMAEQTAPLRRKVALKIIKPGMDTAEVIARFEAERQALAMMDHPNIARVLDAGTTGDPFPSNIQHPASSIHHTGRPYFVMELVHGEPITTFADSRQLSIRERLQLFVQVCRAVQHAHQKGVIHRDLKPSNVMVTQHDGVPVTKIIDFGVAKALSQPLTNKTLFTRYGTIVGTPQYMSPEQAEMSGLGVDTRSDVYSLGILLYELLTGRPPITSESLHNAGIDEIRRVIKDVDPPTPSICVKKLPADTARTVAANRSTQSEPLGKRIRGDLDRIAMKALSKDREQRYESAGALSDDVERHLAGDPVHAVAPSYWYVLRKLAAKRRSLFITAGAIAASTLVGLVFFAWQFRETLAARDSLQRELYQAEMLEAQAAWDENNFDRMIELLKRWDPAYSGTPGRDYRDIAWYFLWKLAESTSVSKRFDLNDIGLAVELSSNSESAAVSEHNRTLLSDVDKNNIRNVADHKSTRFYCFADFSPDDQWLLCPHEDVASVQLVDVLNGSTHRLKQDAFVNQAAFSNDGRWLAVAHKKGVTLWERVQDDPASWVKHDIGWSGTGASAVAFTVDSSELYIGTEDSRVLSISVRTGNWNAYERFSHDAFKVWAIACSGDLVASAGKDVRVFDRQLQRVVQTIGGHPDEVRGVCFSPDGGTLVLGGRDGSISVWNLPSFALIGRLPGHSGIVQGLDAGALPDGSWRLASLSQDYTVRLWDMPRAIQARHLQTDDPVIAAVLARDASTIAYVTTPPGPSVETDLMGPFPLFGISSKSDRDRMRDLSKYCIRVRDLATQRDRSCATRDEKFNWIALSAGSAFALGTGDGRVKVGNVATGETSHIQLSHPVDTTHEMVAAFSQDGRWLALNHGDGSITVWNVEAGRSACTIRAPTLKRVGVMVFGDEGTTLVFLCGDAVCIHEAATGKLIVPPFRHRHRDYILCLSYSHTARRLAIGSFDDTASVWSIDDSPTELSVLRGHRASIRGIYLVDGARHVLTVGGDHCTKLWDSQTGRMRLTLHNTNWTSTSASDGRTLATLGRRSIQFFRYATPEEVAGSLWWHQQLSTRNRVEPTPMPQFTPTDGSP